MRLLASPAVAPPAVNAKEHVIADPFTAELSRDRLRRLDELQAADRADMALYALYVEFTEDESTRPDDDEVVALRTRIIERAHRIQANLDAVGYVPPWRR